MDETIRVRIVGNGLCFPPTEAGGWVHCRMDEPPPGVGKKMLVLEASSGPTRWPCGILTAPSFVVELDEFTYRPIVCPGVYDVSVSKDKKGLPVVRLGACLAASSSSDLPFLLGINGEAEGVDPTDPDMGGPQGRILMVAHGFSRTGRHHEAWSLVVARAGEVVRYKIPPAEAPVIAYVCEDGTVDVLGEMGLSPDEW